MPRAKEIKALLAADYKQGCDTDRESSNCQNCHSTISGRRVWWRVLPNYGDPTEPVSYCRSCAIARTKSTN